MEYLALSQLNAGQLDAVRAIYEEAFPDWQRDPFEGLVADRADSSRLGLAMLDGGRVLAFATLARFESVPWWFLEYFAVVDGRRDQGLGGRLWEALLERLGGGSGRRIVLEVEAPDQAPVGSAERVTRERRLGFYRRRGARSLDVPEYRVPRLTDTSTEPMLLLGIPEGGEPLPTDGPLEALVRAMYVEGYGLPSVDPLIEAALASTAGGKAWGR